MNLLIVTPFYKHDRNIASVRWTNIATRLAKRHKVIVVTQPHDDMDETREIVTDEDGVLVARLNQKSGYERFAVKHFGAATGDDWQTSSGSGEAASAPRDSMTRKLKNRLFYSSLKKKAKQYAKDIVKNVIPDGTKIDVVISSACPFIEMLFGYELKKRLGCKWISDFRDLPFYRDTCDDTHMMKRLMHKALHSADQISVVVPSMVADLSTLVEIPSENISVIPNGFSRKDYREDAETYADQTLHLGFTGTLYSDGSESNMLFEALLRCKEKEPSFDAVIDCAGGNCHLLEKTAEAFGLAGVVRNIGFVPREDALALQRKSDCLLVFINAARGGFAAKIYEYLLCKKPIININYGQHPGGDSKPFINDYRLGLAVDECSKDVELPLLCDYLLTQFRQKQNGQPMLYDPVTEEIQKYDHDSIVEQVENLIN